MVRARAAFEALSEADRRGVQGNLVWAGVYKGAADGEFGRLTFAALRAFTSKRPGAAEGVLSPQDRAALAADAARARSALGFAPVNERRAGVSIGVPQKLFTVRSETPNGARFETADKGAGLETFRHNEGETTLQTLYDTYRTPIPNRKVTYSVIRPDFLVVTAETATRATYTRVARGSADGRNVLRGFILSWPKAQQARYETLAVGIANSFEPFGQAPQIAKAPDSQKPGTAQDKPIPVPPPQPVLAAAAIAFAPNRYVAALREPVCDGARIGARPAKLLRHDPAAGLALFDVAGGAGRRLRAPAGKPEINASAVVLFASPGEGASRATQVSGGSGEIAGIAEGGKSARVRIFMPAEAAGGLALARTGELVGLVAAAPLSPFKVAGAPPPASRALVTAAALGEFLAASGLEFVPGQPAANAQSVGQIAGAYRESIEGLWCMQQQGAR